MKKIEKIKKIIESLPSFKVGENPKATTKQGCFFTTTKSLFYSACGGIRVQCKDDFEFIGLLKEDRLFVFTDDEGKKGDIAYILQ